MFVVFETESHLVQDGFKLLMLLRLALNVLSSESWDYRCALPWLTQNVCLIFSFNYGCGFVHCLQYPQRPRGGIKSPGVVSHLIWVLRPDHRSSTEQSLQPPGLFVVIV